jgi:opacity protein-like surface antigen
MRKAMVLGVVSLAGLLASPAFADEFTGFRMGFQMSQDKLDGFYNHSIVNPPSPSSTKSDSDQLGYALFGGWALNKYLAAEAGFHVGTHFSKLLFPAFVDSIDTNPATEGSEYYVMRQQFKSVDASVVGSWWINDKISLFGRAGLMAWQGRVYYAYGDAEPPVTVPVTRPFKNSSHVTDEGFAPMFGVGIQTQLDHSLVRFEYQYADIGDVAFGSNFSSTDNTFSSLTFSIVWTL